MTQKANSIVVHLFNNDQKWAENEGSNIRLMPTSGVRNLASEVLKLKNPVDIIAYLTLCSDKHIQMPCFARSGSEVPTYIFLFITDERDLIEGMDAAFQPLASPRRGQADSPRAQRKTKVSAVVNGRR